MAPRVPTLAQSESKSKFFERLDLSKDDPADKQLYAMMKVTQLLVVLSCLC